MIRFLFCLLAILCGPKIFGQIEVSLSTSQSTITTSEQGELQVVVKGTRDGAEPSFPTSADYEVQRGSVSSQVHIINGAMTAELIYTYYLIPSRIGRITVGPVRVRMKNKTFKSNLIHLNVVKSGSKSPEDVYYFLSSVTDQKKVYKNQRIIYTWRFYNRQISINNGEIKLPEFDGFWKEQIEKRKEFQEVKDGIKWNVTEFKFALYPTSPGKKTIEGTQLKFEVLTRSKRRRGFGFLQDSFFSGGKLKALRLVTKPIDIDVMPVPADPITGVEPKLVGRFSVSSQLNKTQVKVSESITLTIRLQGYGNTWDARLKKMEIPGLKVYADKPEDQKMGVMTNVKVFKFALVPTEAQETTIPAIAFLYFDPETKKHHTVSTDPVTLAVFPSDEKETLAHTSAPNSVSKKKEVEILGQDLMLIKSDLNQISRDALGRSETIALLGTTSACPLLFVLLLLFRRRWERIDMDEAYAKREKAMGTFKSHFSHLKKTSNFYQEASATLRKYIGDKVGVEGTAMTETEIETLLKQYKVDETLVKDTKTIIGHCDAGLYGGRDLTDEIREDIYLKLGRVVKALDRSIKT